MYWSKNDDVVINCWDYYARDKYEDYSDVFNKILCKACKVSPQYLSDIIECHFRVGNKKYILNKTTLITYHINSTIKTYILSVLDNEERRHNLMFIEHIHLTNEVNYVDGGPDGEVDEYEDLFVVHDNLVNNTNPEYAIPTVFCELVDLKNVNTDWVNNYNLDV